jgi:hypothetical protein
VWLERYGPLDLVVTLDDASSEVYSTFLVEEEGTVSSFLGLIATIAAKGPFCSLYTDCGRHYFHAPEAGGKVASGAVTQVGRALADSASSRTGRTSCAPRSGSITTRKANWLSSADHDDWSDGSPVRRTTPFPYRRPEPALAAGEGCGRGGQVTPRPPRPQQNGP